jgi:chorismate lyase/3-hydroxybenzoate synthase
LRVDYREHDLGETFGNDVLAAITFGESGAHPSDPRCIRVPLEPRLGRGLAQVWTGKGPVKLGESGLVRHAEDGSHLMGWLEVDEVAHGGLAAAAEAAYGALLEFHAASRYRHLWRLWNFIGDINAGGGDAERYKQFCMGRARAFTREQARFPGLGYPAATAVGTLDGRRCLHVCWLAGVEAGLQIENPRQVSAFRYPRGYGPASPTFSRALLTPAGHLLVSGTASIVGHGSMHTGDATAQLEETLRNLDAVTATATSRGTALVDRPPLLTVFLRPPVDAAAVERRVREHYSTNAGIVILDAAICRTELLLEIEAIG